MLACFLLLVLVLLFRKFACLKFEFVVQIKCFADCSSAEFVIMIKGPDDYCTFIVPSTAGFFTELLGWRCALV